MAILFIAAILRIQTSYESNHRVQAHQSRWGLERLHLFSTESKPEEDGDYAKKIRQAFG